MILYFTAHTGHLIGGIVGQLVFFVGIGWKISRQDKDDAE